MKFMEQQSRMTMSRSHRKGYVRGNPWFETRSRIFSVVRQAKLCLAELISKLLEFEQNKHWHGMEIIVPHLLAIFLRGVSIRFKAILLRGVALAVLLQGVAHVVTAHSEHLFYNRASVPEAAKLGLRKHLVLHLRVCQQEKELEDKQESGLVDKEILVLFIIDTHCEIKKVNNDC